VGKDEPRPYGYKKTPIPWVLDKKRKGEKKF
jgi:hypothetical protein